MIYDFNPEIMRHPYYNLGFSKKKKKKFKSITLLYNDWDLSHLNRILNVILQNLRIVKNSPWISSGKVLKLLDEIIPDEYFGSVRNRKLFYEIVNLIATQSFQECIYFDKLTRGYDYQYILWLHHLRDENVAKAILKRSNYFLLETVVKPLILFFYKPVKTYNGHEIQFIPLNIWHSYEDKIFESLLKKKFLVENASSGVKSRGCLKFVPKGKLEELKFRPIVTCFRRSPTEKSWHKLISQKIHNATRKINVHFSTSLYNDWKEFAEKHNNGERIYGIKLDIEDAFGNVNVSFLLDIVSAMEEVTTAEKNFLRNHIQNQYVMFRKKIYKWEHGLLQGDYFSAILCELYMTEYDRTRIPRGVFHTFIYRTVDDYFFCSTEMQDVQDFSVNIPQIHTINDSKTIMNLSDHTQEIPFCGLIFNLQTFEVKTVFNLKRRFEIRHKFKLWNRRQPIPLSCYSSFLQKAVSIAFSSTYLNKMQLNTCFNSQKTVLENFFEAMIFVAYKFDAAIMALRHYFIEDFDFIYPILINCVKVYSVKVRKRIHSNVGKKYHVTISYKMLVTIALKAFLAVFKRRNEIYKFLIEKIREDFHLHFQYRIPGLDARYFSKLPASFQGVKISRKVVI